MAGGRDLLPKSVRQKATEQRAAGRAHPRKDVAGILSRPDGTVLGQPVAESRHADSPRPVLVCCSSDIEPRRGPHRVTPRELPEGSEPPPLSPPQRVALS